MTVQPSPPDREQEIRRTFQPGALLRTLNPKQSEMVKLLNAGRDLIALLDAARAERDQAVRVQRGTALESDERGTRADRLAAELEQAKQERDEAYANAKKEVARADEWFERGQHLASECNRLRALVVSVRPDIDPETGHGKREAI